MNQHTVTRIFVYIHESTLCKCEYGWTRNALKQIPTGQTDLGFDEKGETVAKLSSNLDWYPTHIHQYIEQIP